jgi:serine/threonine-protein kinase
MQTDRAQQVVELVGSALDREPQEWAAFLDSACAGDSALRAEVESLLQCREQAHDFIEAPVFPFAVELLEDESEPLEGNRVGPYKIIRIIGRGGMGDVYLASRADDQYRKEVAIKLVKRGFDTDDIRRRFRHERQILATLDHPNIARLIDGGTTETGLPYFVMDYVDGITLNRYCDEHKLNITERLKLFRTVCSAVHYAHQHLVIHRDIKPDNILVTAEGAPKLLDFGIAKLLDSDLSQTAGHTVTELKVMTPEYASPEQVKGEQVTTATDTYSLGVLLYELLTGHRPYRFKSLKPTEIERAICAREPERPSTIVGRVEELTDERGATTGQITPEAVSATRGEQPEGLRRRLKGDLDSIVLMAMRKEPERRYSSVEQFSEDIRRHLEGLPVIARRDTFDYRAKKFIRRHKVGVGATLVIVLALVAGIIAIARETRLAREERDKEQHINAFLQDMLSAAAPEIKGTDIKVVDVLNEASNRAKSELADKPGVMADVLLTVGRTYVSLGKWDLAETNLRTGLDASLKANGESHPTTASTMAWLGLTLLYRNKVAEGEQISRQAVALERKLHPEGHADLGVALYGLGGNLIAEGDAKEAIPYLQEAEAMIKQFLGNAHGYHLATLGMLGQALEQSGDVNGAESLYRQAIVTGRTVEYRYRIFLAQSLSYLGFLLMNKGAYSEAESTLQESEKIYREQLGDSSYSVGVTQVNLARVYFLQGNYKMAEPEFRSAIDLLEINSSREEGVVVSAIAGLGLTLTRAGKPKEGEPFVRQALEIRKKVLPAGDLYISLSESALGECLLAQKRYSEAEPFVLRGYEGLKAKVTDQDPRTVDARKKLVSLYEALGKVAEAARYRS